MDLQIHIPSTSQLSEYVTGIWEIFGDRKVNETILPKGVVEMVFNLGDPMHGLLPGATFTWNFPPGWTANTNGTGDRTLVVTNIPAYPSYPTYVTIDVTSSLGGTATIVVTLEDCGSGGPWKCTDGGDVENREQPQKISTPTAADITMFPNPAKDRITVQSNSEKIENVKVFDITGECIYDSKTTAGSQFSIDLTKFSTGTYFISIQLNKETITKRFVKVD